jgi:hypothetical protein
MEAIMSKRRVAATSTILGCVAVLAGAQAAVEKPAAKEHEDFPFAIDFEQGTIEFDAGDFIIIDEVRGTSEDMESGICRISGTYRLASEESATLAASVTARRAEDGVGPWNTAQRMTIAKGEGSFVLVLPISVEGWPHVSFYNDSQSIGGVYLGAGDAVLRSSW